MIVLFGRLRTVHATEGWRLQGLVLSGLLSKDRCTFRGLSTIYPVLALPCFDCRLRRFNQLELLVGEREEESGVGLDLSEGGPGVPQDRANEFAEVSHTQLLRIQNAGVVTKQNLAAGAAEHAALGLVAERASAVQSSSQAQQLKV